MLVGIWVGSWLLLTERLELGNLKIICRLVVRCYDSGVFQNRCRDSPQVSVVDYVSMY